MISRESLRALLQGVLVLFLAILPHRQLLAQSAAAGMTCASVGVTTVVAPQACLTTLVAGNADGSYTFNGLELAAAKADDAAFLNLLSICGPSGGGCKGSQLGLFQGLRQLEDNAAELLGLGESQFSLHLSSQSLGFALRWTADEEYSTQSSLTNRLASSQLDAVGNRLNMVRILSETLRFARGGEPSDDSKLADAQAAYGGGASADGDTPGVGRWSVFSSAAYGDGSKEPTTFNDAFNFSQTQFLGGADIRPTAHTLVGVLGSAMQQHADFNSAASVTSGTLRSSGGGLTGYFERDWNAAFVNASVGVQRMSIDTRRLVTYPSNNPQQVSVNTNFLSSTDATSWLATIGVGYTFYWRAFSAEPYLNAQYLGTRIGSFVESGHGTTPQLALRVSGQGITSLQNSVGLRLQYAWSVPFGVLLPYGYGEYRHEFRDKAQAVNSQYVDSQPTTDQFQLPTDSIDPTYYEVGGGLLTVLPHGLQLYAQYMKLLQLQYYSYYAVSGGLRFQF